MRALLIIAMVVSLWPAGAIAAIALSGDSNTTTGSGSASEPQGTAEEAAQPSEDLERAEQTEELNETLEDGETGLDPVEREIRAEQKLAKVAEETRDLSEQFVQVELEEGVPESVYVTQADELEGELMVWEAKFSSAASSQTRNLARALVDQLRAMQTLAEGPNQEALNAYNDTIEGVNRAINRLP